MKSKQAIERQLAHFKTDCDSARDPALAQEIVAWVKALEWVLGDKADRVLYDAFIAHLEESAALPDDATPGERVLALTLELALRRLR